MQTNQSTSEEASFREMRSALSGSVWLLTHYQKDLAAHSIDIKSQTSTSHIYSAWMTWKYRPEPTYTYKISQGITHKFGLEKCKTLHVQEGTLREGGFILLSGDQTGRTQNQLYKYLGFKKAKLQYNQYKCNSSTHIFLWSNTLDIHRVTTAPKENTYTTNDTNIITPSQSLRGSPSHRQKVEGATYTY